MERNAASPKLILPRLKQDPFVEKSQMHGLIKK